ncbi:MAG: glycosyltransferase family 39 protein [Nitrospirae bacterium]|nr:glycosyltransferase family 39 protein [Nitrospirota bacterium]
MFALKKNDYILIISLLTLIVFIVLFSLRSIDDNRLTNWQWAFSFVNASRVFLILVLGIFPAYILSRISLLDHYPASFLFFFSYMITTLIWKEPEVIVDASRYFTQAKHLEVYGIGYFFREWGRSIVAWTDMPLIPFFYGLIFRFFGESRLYIQMFTTFLLSMTVVLTYLIGKSLWSKDIGFFGGLLLLGIPYLLIQTPLMLVDVPTMFFLILSIFTFIKALNCGGMWIGFSSAAVFLCFFSKYSTWLMMSVLVVIFIVYFFTKKSPSPLPSPAGGEGTKSPLSREVQGCVSPHSMGECSLISPPLRGGDEGEGVSLYSKKVIYRGISVISIAFLLIGIVFWYKFDVFSEQIRLLATYQKAGLGRWSESFISTFFFQVHPFITAAALYSIYAALKKRDPKYIIIIWLVLLTVLLRIKRIRYIIMIFPMLSLMASYGLAQIRDKEIIRFISLCVVIFSFVTAIFVYLPFMQKISIVNLKDGGKFLDSLNEPNVEVFVLPSKDPVCNPAISVPILDLFTKKNIKYEYDNIAYYQTWENIEKSPLRFTWEYKNPGYYAWSNDSAKDAAVVVISEEPEDFLPERVKLRLKGYGISRVFNTYDDVFSYRTSISVYRKKGL